MSNHVISVSKSADRSNQASYDRFVFAALRLRFGVFEVSPRERELRKFGLRVRLQQKPFQILERLLQTPGEFVGREELARLLWPDLHVRFDKSLNTAMNVLRRALGDQGRNPRFIETRPGLGYGFIAPVEQVAEPAPGLARRNIAYRGNIEAYQDYLKGRYFLNKLTEEDSRKSIAYFESALRCDLNYALAYAGLADTWSWLGHCGALPPQECFSRAREFAEAALRIDDLLAEAHTSLAGVRKFFDWDWAAAEAGYRRALKLNPNDAAARCQYARHLSTMGRFEDAVKEIRAAQELDPLSLVISTEVAWILYLSRDFSAAVEQSWKALAMEPRFAPAQNTLGLAYAQMGMVEEGIVELDNARVCSENHPAAVAALGCALATAGRPREAEESLADLKRAARTRHVSAYWLSIVHAGLGECDLAFESLQKAHREHDAWLVWLNVEPRFDRLREDARFEELLQGIGLPRGASCSAG